MPSEKKSTLDILLDLGKWVVGTVIIGCFSTSISNEFKRTELELKRMETDAKLIESVSGKFDTSANIQFKYLSYIQPFITTDSLKKGINEKLVILRAELTQDRIDSVKEIINQNLDQQRIDSVKFKRLKFRPTPAVQTPISELKESERQVAGNVIKTPLDSGATEKLNNLKKLVVPKVFNNYALVGPPETFWVKKGYYVEYNNGQLRIGLNDIDSRSVDIRISSIADKNSINVLNESLTLTSGTARGISDPKLDFRYEVSLDYVGSAGRNPFTKAAYITVSTYRKDNMQR